MSIIWQPAKTKQATLCLCQLQKSIVSQKWEVIGGKGKASWKGAGEEGLSQSAWGMQTTQLKHKLL